MVLFNINDISRQTQIPVSFAFFILRKQNDTEIGEPKILDIARNSLDFA